MKENGSHVSRKISISVIAGTTLISVCSPALQSVVYAEDVAKPVTKLSTPLPEPSSVVNDVNALMSNSIVYSNTAGPIEASSETESEEVSDSTENGSSEEPVTSDKPSSSESSTGNTSSSNGGNSNSNNNTGGNTGSSSSSKPGVKPSNSTSKDKGTTKPSTSSSTSSSQGKTIDSNKKTTSSKQSNAPIKYTRNQSTAEFIEEIGETARDIGQKNDLYASVMIAQAILESGSGNSGLSRQPNYNLFGIKGSYKGESTEMATLEDDGDGGMFTISAKFRKYPSYKESLEDYATLMTGGTSGRSTYYQGAWKSNTQNYKEATKYLTGRYATDTRYNEKLNGLIETYNLAQYDQKKSVETKLKKSKETEQFIKDVSGDIEKIADENDLYASVLIAEAIINSTSGNNTLSEKKNIYQTTGEFEGKSVKIDTVKKDKSDVKLVEVEYKEYPTYEDAVKDYVTEMKKDKTSYEEMTRSKKNTYRKVTAYLTAKNEKDRKYHKKLNAMINTYDLTQYDKESAKSKRDKKNKKETEKQKLETLDMLTEIGKDMTNKLSESLTKPTKYQVTQK